ncbi:BaiN/RdsA family NAD(P)/FAD-dependent oxidoreductase [Achromobacter aloeverae]|uniref:Aminoacetone oxidase family FAD-binding enzyme n=1 Tax=Achromobacter aloeverae TaxID=1750518 RepID=A0A4Q1HKN7_9BURK|nr:NAD(P)/FAD-dependent oxidoreductase [Achromobacter aloeverae]RXN90519.1 aminoacetone oxidase family FAD-binding enzyme [Achromobacter aloeverae]
MTHIYDVAVIGAGAAGMMCAAVAGQRGLRVVLIDHADKLAEKIRISGGGRCNFTNLGAGPANFLSENPHFCRSALAGYGPRDFLELLRRHGVAWHEKHRGQLFCDDTSESIIDVLRAECGAGQVQWRMGCGVAEIAREAAGADGDAAARAGAPDGVFVLRTTTAGTLRAAKLVIATGGMAIPQLGATDYGLKVARQFGLKVVEPRPALVPLTFDPALWQPFAALSGVALEAGVRSGQGEFLEDLLFTHRGLSGPAILQISSYWNPGEPLSLDLAPGLDLGQDLVAAKPGNRQQLGTVLAGLWPRRLAEAWLEGDGLATQRLADIPDKTLRALAARIHDWTLVPTGTAGYKKAEVMRGGVDTRGLDQKSMQARAVSGLHFIGEAVDVTGWLGGYNFQWAWASAVACGKAL